MIDPRAKERDYANVVSALTSVLSNLPGKLIAIDGRLGVGKTTLGRYLSGLFNVTLLETDLFLVANQGLLVYRDDEILRIVDHRIKRDQPIIVEGVAVLRLLETLKRRADFLIYVLNENVSVESPAIDAELSAYEVVFAPRDRADLILNLDHTG